MMEEDIFLILEKRLMNFEYELSEIAIDSKGNKWLITENGLLKFDGENWTIYKSNDIQYPTPYLWKMSIDSKDNIWLVSIHEGDIAKFDGTNWTIKQGLIHVGGDANWVLSLDIDKLDNLWIATTYNGIFVFKEGGVILTSVEDMPLNELERIIIYPNPAENTIKFSDIINPGDKYIITDLSGKKVQIGIIESDELDITALKSGFYFIIIITNSGHHTIKFVKE
jgi:hypothetical protein